MRACVRYLFPDVLQIALFYQRRQIEGCLLRADCIERQPDLQIIDHRAGRFLAGLTIDRDDSLFRLTASLDLYGEERRAFESPGEPPDLGLSQIFRRRLPPFPVGSKAATEYNSSRLLDSEKGLAGLFLRAFEVVERISVPARLVRDFNQQRIARQLCAIGCDFQITPPGL